MHALEHILTTTEAKPTSQGKYLGHCPAHGSKRHRDLSVRVTDTKILLHCFAGCLTPAICESLGLELKDLFTDALDPNPQKRKAAARQGERLRKQQAAEAQQQGRRIDALKAADYHIRSRRGLDISGWSDQKLDDELSVLADAYALLVSEDRDG